MEHTEPLTMTAQSVHDPSHPNIRDNRISVRSLWKIYGPNPSQVLQKEWRHRSKKQILKELNCVVALKDVNLDVHPGEVFVVMGLSGSGKSTLVRCLLRLIEPTAGQVIVDGEDILSFNHNQLIGFRRNKVAMIFQHFGLMPHRRVLDNVAWGLEVQHVDKETRIHRAREVLEMVGLNGWEDRYPEELSGGMQQRVGIARALAVDPEILLMDEPFSGLDPLIRREMQDEFLRIEKQIKKTIVFITHDLSEALKMGDRIAIMRDGVIVQSGSAEEIVASPSDQYVAEFTRDVRKASVLTVRSIMTQPRSRLYVSQEPKEAIQAMSEVEADLAFVIDSEQRFQGSITLEAAANVDTSSLTDILDTTVPPVSQNSSVESILPIIVDSNNQLPVVDEDGRLVGEVHRKSVVDMVIHGSNDPNLAQTSQLANTTTETPRNHHEVEAQNGHTHE